MAVYQIHFLFEKDIEAEVRNNRDRIDPTLKTTDFIGVFELKLGRSNSAIDQTKEKDNQDKGLEMVEIAVGIDLEAREYADWQILPPN